MQPVSFVSSLRVQHGYVASDLAHGPTSTQGGNAKQ